MSYKLSLMKDGEGTLQNGLPLLNTVMPVLPSCTPALAQHPKGEVQVAGLGPRREGTAGRKCSHPFSAASLLLLLPGVPVWCC